MRGAASEQSQPGSDSHVLLRWRVFPAGQRAPGAPEVQSQAPPSETPALPLPPPPGFRAPPPQGWGACRYLPVS